MLKILLIVALIVVAIVVVRLQGNTYKRFMADAGEVMGKIEKKETRIEGGHSQRAGAGDNVLIYSYMVDGKPYVGEDKVEYDDLWLDARAGQELRVYYAEKNPSKSYPAALIERRLNIAEKVR